MNQSSQYLIYCIVLHYGGHMPVKLLVSNSSSNSFKPSPVLFYHIRHMCFVLLDSLDYF